MKIRVVNVTASNLRKLGIDSSEVVYVGRSGRFHKWPHHALANPFKPTDIKYRHWGTEANKREACLADYRSWLLSRPNVEQLLAELWEQCKGGELILGCWCVTAEHGDGQPIVCHAQILAEELYKRFVEGK